MLLATIENVLNRGLPRSPRAQQICAELAGRKVSVEVSDIGRVLVQSTGLCLKLSPVSAEALANSPPDAHIIGGPFSLLAMGGSVPEAPLQRADARIEGDAEVAQKFRQLALLLRPDLEEELSLVLGDVPAHYIGRFARGVVGWTRKAANTTVHNLAEYLAHEQRDLVPRAEADQFLSGVERLREDVDRLAARIDLLPRP